jgi:hypothetical protein
MNRDDVQVGSTITNGSSALRITERVEKDPRYKTSGWRGMCIPLEEFGGNRGMSSFVPDYLLESWHHVPFEWRAIPGNMEERYVWEPRWRWLNREVRVGPLAVGDHVRITGWDEGVGIVRRAEEGKVWVETSCNMYRGYQPDMFARTADPLPEGLTEEVS